MIVFYSPNDRVVDSDHIEGFFDQLSVRPRRLVAVGDAEDPQQHVLAGNILSPSTTDRMASQIVQFVHQVAGDKAI